MTAEIRRPEIAPLPGTYALILRRTENTGAEELRIGRLEHCVFPSGFYAYVGSAFGPGGVRKRVERHLRREKRQHWHIDFFLPSAEIKEVWWTYDPERQECNWSRAMESLAGAISPCCPGFGSSDCRCRSHLFFFPSLPSFTAFEGRVRTAVPNHGEIGRTFL